MLARRLASAILLLALLVVARAARADSPYDGKWKQGPLKENFSVVQWLAGCGPAPVTGSTGGGEMVTIHKEGDELSFIGGGRVYKSNQCYDPMPTLSRESHSRDPSGKQWRTRCTTPPGDPRRATMNTLVAVTTPTHIDMLETGRYEITLAQGKCIADVKRSRGYDLVQADTPVATTPPPVATPTQTAVAPPKGVDCSQPGDPASLAVRPSRKLLKTGESFAFRATVVDAKGCATRTPVTWSSGDTSRKVTVDDHGNVTVAADAPEGTVDVTATAAGKSAKVSVEVSSPAHYDDLLAQSGLNAAGESDSASTVVIASGSIGGGSAESHDGSMRRRLTFIAIVAVASALLALLAFFGWRRSKKAAALARDAEERHQERLRDYEDRKRMREEEHAAQTRAHEESVKRAEAIKAQRAAARSGDPNAMECPSCRREYPAGSQFCPHDGSNLIHRAKAGAPLGNVCPVCRRGYDSATKTCPADGEELVPYAMFVATAQPAQKTRGKICPTCGGRFDGDAGFCGKDGTALVLLN